MIDGQDFFGQPWSSDNVQKFTIGQENDCKTDCLLDYPYFKENYKLTAIDLNKQQALDADPKATQ